MITTDKQQRRKTQRLPLEGNFRNDFIDCWSREYISYVQICHRSIEFKFKRCSICLPEFVRARAISRSRQVLRYPSFRQETSRTKSIDSLSSSFESYTHGGRWRIGEKLDRKKRWTRDGYRQRRRRVDVEPSPRVVVATLDTVKRGDWYNLRNPKDKARAEEAQQDTSGFLHPDLSEH